MVSLPQLPVLHGAFHHDKDHQVPLHAHPQYEIIVVCSGNMRTEIAGTDYLSVPGMIHVIPPGVRHDQRCESRWKTICLLCLGVEHLVPDAGLSIDASKDPLPQRWAEDLCILHRDGAPPACTGSLLFALFQRIKPQLAPEQTLPTAIDIACAWMEEHLADPITDEHVAAVVDMSVSHLGALFRQHRGCGPLRWFQRQRMLLAARLLMDPYTSVAAIARACGYADPTHFIRHFKRQHGQTPGRFRHQGLSA